jgi:FAD/FMN-containing dehydrogenase
MLGGGLGRQQGKYGLGIDNMLSARVVDAEGQLITVSATENSDLWYGLRGAGHNFGIVTSVTVKAYPAVNDNKHWASTLIFPPQKIEAVVEAIASINMKEEMAIHIFMMCPPPMFEVGPL